MTAIELIGLADLREPNHYDTAQKLSWLYELDRRICLELMPLRPNAKPPKPYKTGREELLLPPGWEELYIQWLISRISAANGESERHNRAALIFNELYAACRGFCIRAGLSRKTVFIV